jgi:hypothetical protein
VCSFIFEINGVILKITGKNLLVIIDVYVTCCSCAAQFGRLHSDQTKESCMLFYDTTSVSY